MIHTSLWTALTVVITTVGMNAAAAFALSDPALRIIEVVPTDSTTSVPYDADDPSIWIHPREPEKSLILGTDKAKVHGGLYVWDLEGNLLQYIPLNRPNNVDVRHNMQLSTGPVDIAVVNIREEQALRVYAIDPETRRLTDITTPDGIKTPEIEEAGGVSLYRRPRDGAMFVITSSDEGPSASMLYQYRLQDDGSGRVKGTLVRTFAHNVILDKVEGLVVDDELGYIYASDEEFAVRKFYADPDLNRDDQITEFAPRDDGIRGDREGLAIYKCDERTGYILLSNQKSGTVKVYPREGVKGNPHYHPLLATIYTKDSRETDGLDVTSAAIPPLYPQGFLVKHDSPRRLFRIYSWEQVVGAYIKSCSGEQSRK